MKGGRGRRESRREGEWEACRGFFGKQIIFN